MNRRRLPSSSTGRPARQFPAPRNFTELGDTFPNYTGRKNQFIVVNPAETALISIDLPPLAITDTFVVNSQAAMLALTAQTGDVAIRTDINQTYILQGTDPTILADWALLLVSPTHAIGGALHTADTLANLKTKISAPDILITSQAAEISTLTNKAAPTTSDLLIIEDAADTNKKKNITLGSLPAVAPAAHDLAGALHNADTITNLNLKLSDGDLITTKAAEISAIANKAAPTTSDLLIIEDAADANKKKNITLGSLPAGTPAAHDLAGALHNADTITNLNLKLSDGDLITTKAAEISAITNKAAPTTSDLLIIEDAADANKKKNITLGSLPAAAPAAHDLAGALHNADTITNLNLKLSDGDIISTKAAEINALTAKASPTTSDLLIIEDAADTNKKKKITIGTLPAAAPAAHDLAGALHNADTITNLNLKLSDGDLITTKAAEIDALTSKASPTTNDLLIIEDAADTNKKKKITIGSLPGSSFPAALSYQIENFNPYDFGQQTDYGWTIHQATRNKIQFPAANFVGNADTIAFLNFQRHDYYDHAASPPVIDIDFNFFANTDPSGEKVARFGVKAYYISDTIELGAMTPPAISTLSNYQNVAIHAVGEFRKVLFTNITVNLFTGSSWDTHGSFLLFFGRYATHADDTYAAGGCEIVNCCAEYILKQTTP